MMTGSGPVVPRERRIRTDTAPDGPPGTVVSVTSTSGLAISPDCTSSTVWRPFSGPRSNRYGGSAVASANSWAASSSTGLVVMSITDLVVTATLLWLVDAGDSRPLGRSSAIPSIDEPHYSAAVGSRVGYR